MQSAPTLESIPHICSIVKEKQSSNPLVSYGADVLMCAMTLPSTTIDAWCDFRQTQELFPLSPSQERKMEELMLESKSLFQNTGFDRRGNVLFHYGWACVYLGYNLERLNHPLLKPSLIVAIERFMGAPTFEVYDCQYVHHQWSRLYQAIAFGNVYKGDVQRHPKRIRQASNNNNDDPAKFPVVAGEIRDVNQTYVFSIYTLLSKLGDSSLTNTPLYAPMIYGEEADIVHMENVMNDTGVKVGQELIAAGLAVFVGYIENPEKKTLRELTEDAKARQLTHTFISWRYAALSGKFEHVPLATRCLGNALIEFGYFVTLSARMNVLIDNLSSYNSVLSKPVSDLERMHVKLYRFIIDLLKVSTDITKSAWVNLTYYSCPSHLVILNSEDVNDGDLQDGPCAHLQDPGWAHQ